MSNKKRLISADTAKEMIVNHANEFSDMLNRREKALLIGGGTSCIDKCPTVDAVEVVRCKDCKSYVNRECKNLVRHMTNPCSIYTLPNDFCSYGGRRDNE